HPGGSRRAPAPSAERAASAQAEFRSDLRKGSRRPAYVPKNGSVRCASAAKPRRQAAPGRRTPTVAGPLPGRRDRAVLGEPRRGGGEVRLGQLAQQLQRAAVVVDGRPPQVIHVRGDELTAHPTAVRGERDPQHAAEPERPPVAQRPAATREVAQRSEERRVGKEWRSGWSGARSEKEHTRRGL